MLMGTAISRFETSDVQCHNFNGIAPVDGDSAAGRQTAGEKPTRERRTCVAQFPSVIAAFPHMSAMDAAAGNSIQNRHPKP
jgi:hypothetical protein